MIIVKESQNKRDRILLKLKENISINRDILPEEFVKAWQDFEEQNKELQLKESEEWIKLKEVRFDFYFPKILNILLVLCVSGGVLMNFALVYAYYQYKIDAIETINKVKIHE